MTRKSSRWPPATITDRTTPTARPVRIDRRPGANRNVTCCGTLAANLGRGACDAVVRPRG